jgi:hypothetical protein
MSKYAILENDYVKNVIVADSMNDASIFGHAVEIKPDKFVTIGAKYDHSSNTFILESVEENASI